MQTRADGTSSQEEPQARSERRRETGRVHAIVGGSVWVLMDGVSESDLFAVYVEKDAFYTSSLSQWTLPTCALPERAGMWCLP